MELDERLKRAERRGARAREREARPWFKRRSYWVLGVVVVGYGVFLLAHPGGKIPTDTLSAAPQCPKVATTSDARSGSICKPVSDGNFTFLVEAVQCGAIEAFAVQGMWATGEVVAPGRQECVITAIVTDSTTARHFYAADQLAFDRSGRRFPADTKGLPHLALSNNGTLITPGTNVRVFIPFQIPKQDSITSLQLHDAPATPGAMVTT